MITVSLDTTDNSAFICRVKLHHKNLNGIKIWKRDDETPENFNNRIKVESNKIMEAIKND